MGTSTPPGVDVLANGVFVKRAQKINFTSNLTTTDPGDSQVDVAATGGGPGSSMLIKDEGVSVDTAASSLDFVGKGIKASGPGTGAVTITAPGAVQDLLANRPSAANGEGELFYATDTGVLYISDGSTWTAVIASVAGGGTGATTQAGALTNLNAVTAGVDVSQAGTIANSAVSNAKLANMADQTIKGNNSGGAGAPLDLTAAQVKTLLAITESDVTNLTTDLAAKLAKASNLTDLASRQTALNNLAGAVTNNRVLAGDATNVTLRALAAADIPSLPESQITNLTTDLAAKQPLDQDLTDIAALSGVRGDIITRGASAWGRLALPTTGQGFVSDATDVIAGYPLDTAQNRTVSRTSELAETYPRRFVTSNAMTLTSGTLYRCGIHLPKGLTVTSITFASIGAAGAMTHQFFGLYDSSLVLLRSTGDDTSTAWGANTLKTLNLTSTFPTTYAGLHFIALLVVGTPPTIANTTQAQALSSAAPQMNGNTSDTSQTSLPNPSAAFSITLLNNYAWAGVK